MSISIGRKNITKLYKGNKQIVEVRKGNDIIYQDLEALYSFKITVDASKLTSRTVYIPRSTAQKYSSSTSVYPGWRIDWGDGTVEENPATVRQSNITTVSHTYSDSEVYDITITPTEFENGAPVPGWLNGFRTAGYSYSPQALSSNAIIALSEFPKTSFYIGDKYTNGYKGTDVSYMLYKCSNLHNISDAFFDSIEIADNLEYFYGFTYSFYGCPKEVCDKAILFVKYMVDNYSILSNGSTDTEAFYATFYSAELSSIPEGLFSGFSLHRNSSKTRVFANTFTSATIDTRSLPNIFPADWGNLTARGGFFQGTFANSNITSLANDFSFGRIKVEYGSDFFYNTFSGVKIPRIPSSTFARVDTSACTVFSGMFSGTFSRAMSLESIPADLFSGLDTSSATEMSSMFSSTFSQAGTNDVNNTTLTIPEGLFDFLDMSNVTQCQKMFYATFNVFSSNASGVTIPATLFSEVDTSHCTSLRQMFHNTFASCCRGNPTSTIPEHLFDSLDTSSATDIAGLFYSTFFECCYSSTIASIPDSLFSSLDTRNVTEASGLFGRTFYRCCRSSTSVTFPEHIFDSIDLSNVTSVTTSINEVDQGLFRQTFYETFASAPDFAITNNIFSGISLPNVKRLGNLFFYTFYNNPITSIPATLFSSLQTSSAINFSSMFDSTFARCKLQNIPAGLFSSIDTTSLTTGTEYMFYGTFDTYNLISYAPVTWKVTAQLNDVFDGMPSFNWASASNAYTNLGRTFAGYRRGSTVKGIELTGSASTILQHFNFTPTNDAQTFFNQTQLTDYATINDNWK